MTDLLEDRVTRMSHTDQSTRHRVTNSLPTTRRTFVGLGVALLVSGVGTTVISATEDTVNGPVGFGEGGFGEGGYGGYAEVTEPTIHDYVDSDGVVQTEGLLEAIAEWRNDDLETDVLLDVIDSWKSGETVE